MDPIKGQMMNNMKKDEANYIQETHFQDNEKVYKNTKRKNFWLYVILIIFAIIILSFIF